LREALLHGLTGAEQVRPGSKTSSIEDNPGIEEDVIVSSHGTPARRSCSSGTVISCSTSGADRPSASVWMSTVGRRELGQRVGAHRTGLPHADPDQDRRDHHHEAASPHARPDDPT
jgi:hypothetical protein